MTIFLLHIYDRNGNSLYEKEWCRKKSSNLSKDEEKKLLFGMIHSIKSFVSKMAPKDGTDGFLSYTTSRYKLHFYESPTGLKFILMTDVRVGNLQNTLRNLYSSVYVAYVVRNPLCSVDKPIESSLFEQKLQAFVTGLSFFDDVND